MGHWQIMLWLMVAELWSEIAQDKFIRMGNGFVFKKEEMLPQQELFWKFFSSWQLEGQPEMELFSYQKLN
jgi:hypothetical protein